MNWRMKKKEKKMKNIFFFKQKTAYEIYQCDWSSDVCSSDLQLILIKGRQTFLQRPIPPTLKEEEIIVMPQRHQAQIQGQGKQNDHE